MPRLLFRLLTSSSWQAVSIWVIAALLLPPPAPAFVVNDDEITQKEQVAKDEYLVIGKKTPNKINNADRPHKRLAKPHYGEIIIEPDNDTED